MLARKRIVVAVAAVLVLFSGIALLASTAGHVIQVATFTAQNGELPEGVAIDASGNSYVGLGAPMGPFGEIRKIAPDGTMTTAVSIEGGPGPAGLALDSQERIYYGLFTPDEATRGVYRADGEGGADRLPGTGGMVLPNGLAFDDEDTLYVTDSIPGIIWRIPLGGTAVPWYQDGLLTGCGLDPTLPPVGANGIAIWDGDLYVASTERGLILQIPILAGGGPGEAEVIAGVDDCDGNLDGLDSVDGIAMDMYGDIFAALVIQNKLVKIDRETGDVTELLDGTDGLHNPASIVFGTTNEHREKVFFTNFALLPGPETSLGPALLAYDVGVPGSPYSVHFPLLRKS